MDLCADPCKCVQLADCVLDLPAVTGIANTPRKRDPSLGDTDFDIRESTEPLDECAASVGDLCVGYFSDAHWNLRVHIAIGASLAPLTCSPRLAHGIDQAVVAESRESESTAVELDPMSGHHGLITWRQCSER